MKASDIAPPLSCTSFLHVRLRQEARQTDKIRKSLNFKEKTREAENVEVEDVERVESVDLIWMPMKKGKCEPGVSLRIDAERSVFAVKIAGRKGRRTSRYLILPVIAPAPARFRESCRPGVS